MSWTLIAKPDNIKIVAQIVSLIYYGCFVSQEHKLRALRFLPDIVKLQRFLMDQFHRRIDRTEAEKIKIRDFLRKNVSSSEFTFNAVASSLKKNVRELYPPSTSFTSDSTIMTWALIFHYNVTDINNHPDSGFSGYLHDVMATVTYYIFMLD